MLSMNSNSLRLRNISYIIRPQLRREVLLWTDYLGFS